MHVTDMDGTDIDDTDMDDTIMNDIHFANTTIYRYRPNISENKYIGPTLMLDIPIKGK